MLKTFFPAFNLYICRDFTFLSQKRLPSSSLLFLLLPPNHWNWKAARPAQEYQIFAFQKNALVFSLSYNSAPLCKCQHHLVMRTFCSRFCSNSISWSGIDAREENRHWKNARSGLQASLTYYLILKHFLQHSILFIRRNRKISFYHSCQSLFITPVSVRN